MRNIYKVYQMLIEERLKILTLANQIYNVHVTVRYIVLMRKDKSNVKDFKFDKFDVQNETFSKIS
jgi:hypothetical protein